MIRIVHLVKLFAISTAIFLTGCVSLFHKPSMAFPSDIKPACHGAKNESERLIESKGTKLEVKASCAVIKKVGEKQFSGVWAWFDPGWNMYVCGLCNGKYIWIAVNPANQTDLHSPTLIHEFAHWWLMTNHNNYTHDPKYDDVIFNWKHARDVTGSGFVAKDSKVFKMLMKRKYDELKEGETMSLNYLEADGTRCHVDFIKL